MKQTEFSSPSLVFAFLIFSLVQLLGAKSVTLMWDPNPESNVNAYVVHHGTASRAYFSQTNVGNVTLAVVNGLPEEPPLFFAVTAVTTGGMESEFSNEVIVTNPPPGVETNYSPTITKIPDIAVAIGGRSTNVLFSIQDKETVLTNLIVTATSANTSLLKNENIRIVRDGSNCTMSMNLEPYVFGKARVTVIVSDRQKVAFTSFTLNVLPEPVPVIPTPLIFLSGVQVSESTNGPWTNVTTVSFPIVYQSNLFYRAWGPILQLP
jgi:hypothetical protein